MNDPLRILLIDDNPDDRTLVIRELRREFPDPQVEQITNAESFTRVLETGDFDLVITDYQLRWTDGLQVLRAVKSRYPDRPTIMFTATGSEEIAVEAMKAGLDDYVLKSPKHFIRLPAAMRAALEKARQRQATKEAETRYRNLFERVPVGLYRTTPDGQILDANPAMVEMLGYPDRESLLATNTDDLYVNPKERQRWQVQMEREGLVRDFETQLRRRDGTIIWVMDSARAVQDAEGRVLYYEGSLEDITERKRAEAELRETNIQLQAALQARDEMIQNVSHELRTPLTLIMGYVGLLKEGAFGPLIPEQARIIDVLENQSDQLYFMVNRLLLLQTLDTGTIRKTELDLKLLLQKAVGAWQTRAEEAGIQLSLDISPDLPSLMADPDLLSQVIYNLLDNAIKFSPSKGVVGIRAWIEGNELIIAVSDQGIGIPPDRLERVFESFYQVDGSSTRRFGGMGIGLPLCRRIIEIHGGRIWAESEGEGKGSTFYITLPLRDAMLES